MKTHKGAAKRFRRRKSGSIRRGKARRTHFLTGKSPKRKMSLRQPGTVHEADTNRVERMLQS
jgi:large subunit ribosomal protein L35